jgi:hypothetical protein
MASTKPIDFTITLSNDDWDAIKGGWRCPALQIPGTAVKNIYVAGTAVDPKMYDVNNELCLIRWSNTARPKQAGAHIRIEKALSTEELTLRWRKLAIVLPVIGSLAAAFIGSSFKSSQKSELAPEPKSDKVLISKIFERSNDFLATGDKHQFPSIFKQTKREAWFIGTTFYISTDQYHDLILNRLAEGVDLNFLILNPEGEAVRKVAHLLGVGEKELALDSMSGIRILSRTLDEARKSNLPGTLRVKIVDEPIQTRLYFFDPKADEGRLYYIPQLNGTNSQTLPGFLVENLSAPYHSTYFNGVLKMWNDPGATSLEVWRSNHPDLQ